MDNGTPEVELPTLSQQNIDEVTPGVDVSVLSALPMTSNGIKPPSQCSFQFQPYIPYQLVRVTALKCYSYD